MSTAQNIQRISEMLNIVDGNMTVKLVKIAKNYPSLSPEEKSQAHKVNGCAVDTWLYLDCCKDQLIIKPDSDSMIVKGVMILIAESFRSIPRDEIGANPPLFLAELGIHHHLSPNRRNGIGKVWKIIEEFCQIAIP